MPVGTEVTDESLAGVLGREHEVCVPVTSSIISNNAGDDGDDRGKRSSSIINNSGSSNSNNNNNNNSSGSSDENNSRAWLGQALVLKLRQVNGDGVMSGVCYCSYHVMVYDPAVCLTYSESSTLRAANNAVLLHC